MSAIPREFLYITEEPAYATFNGTPTLGTNQLVIRLDSDNSFTMRAAPVAQDVMYGGGFAVPAYSVSDEISLSGRLSLKLCYSQANIVMPWLITRINSAQTSPWTTTEPPGDLASMTIDHAVYLDDTAAYKATRYLGVKPAGWSLSCSRSQRIAQLDIDLIASKYQGNPFDSSSDPTLSAPTDGNYATDAVVFGHFGLNSSTSAFKIGSNRTRFESIKLDVKHAIDARPFESRFVQVCRVLGRSWTASGDMMLKSSPNDRLAFEQLTAQNVELLFTNGTHTGTLNFETANLIRPLTDNLANDKIYMRAVGLAGFYDATNNADLLWSYS
jgi:hypothetical protein